MPKHELCPFCHRSELRWRTIRDDTLFASAVSEPWFRPGHCLVVPVRHITTVAGLNDSEMVAIMTELGRLSSLLDEGYGAGVMQKYQPGQVENGIKVSHLHWHVFPRQERDEQESVLFPVPRPNNFGGFLTPPEAEVLDWVQRLK
jgi:diadenosine tetraphosphate (Ap4A) HIT family hydrolase